MVNARGFHKRIVLILRLVYGLALIAPLFIPFVFYFSRAEPCVMGNLWGYQLPVGYIGLLLGLLVILAPKNILARRPSFGTAMVVIGLLLIISDFLSPHEYVINVIHGTSFSGGAIDIEYPIGHVVTLYLGLFGIVAGITPNMLVRIPKASVIKEGEQA
jgi:hypothetical protein